MENVKHTFTPGPWHVRHEEPYANSARNYEYTVEHIEGANRTIIAKLHETWVCEEHGSADANARLISLAPNMAAFIDSISNKACQRYLVGDYRALGCTECDPCNARAILSKLDEKGE